MTPAFLIAVMLWGPVRQRMNKKQEDGLSPQEAMRLSVSEVFGQQIQAVSIPRRFTTTTREIWILQARLERRGGRRAFRLLDHERFRAAYDFLCLRTQVGEAPAELCDWWTRFKKWTTPGNGQMVRDCRRPTRNAGRHGPAAEIDDGSAAGACLYWFGQQPEPAAGAVADGRGLAEADR